MTTAIADLAQQPAHNPQQQQELQLAIASALQQTLQPQQQRAGEQRLAELGQSPGQSQAAFAHAVLGVVLADGSVVDANTRFAAALFLKNQLKRHWAADDADHGKQGDAADRQQLRARILPAMVQASRADERLGRQLSECVAVIAARDFPAEWPSLVGELVELFSPADYRTNAAVLQTAHALFKRCVLYMIFVD